MPLRVAIVADVLLAEMGGVARSVSAVVRELARLDPDRLQITIVARRHPPGFDGAAFKRSVAPRVPKLPDSLFALQRPFTVRDFDLVHYMDSRPPVDFPLGRIPKVITQHGFSVLTFTRLMRTRHRRIYMNKVVLLNKTLLRLAPYADLTLTASESERQELLRRTSIDPEQVIAIHHGVDHDQFSPPADVQRAREAVAGRFGLETPYVLYVSNHQRKKNTEGLVRAFARVAREEPDVTLAMTGWQTPRFRLVLELIESLGLASRVKVLGHVPDDALPSLYGGAHVFTLPSLHEGFGLPILEAMACGTPVLTSNIYALPEVAGDAAELVDPYDVGQIAEGLLRLLRDPGHAAVLRERGLRRAADFTWRRSAEQHLAAYERVRG
jgi:glycosyltransferase involved in cell wall biosynthesis